MAGASCALSDESLPAPQVGIFGGSFDPIHNGHVALAQAALEFLQLQRVIFVPTAVSNFKQGGSAASAADRLEMCALAVRGNAAFELCSYEVDCGGVSYTVDTARWLARRGLGRERAVFLIGADAARGLPRWREAAELARIARFCLFARAGTELSSADACALSQAGFRFICAPQALPDISSTHVRAMASQGCALDGLVPPSVASYIQKKGLYRD